MSKGFTLVELIVVIAVIAVLTGVILVSAGQYIDKGKDSNVLGNLAVLIPAGEVFYNSNANSYVGFCDSGVVKNAENQMPENLDGDCSGNDAGVCCNVNYYGNSWAACAREFANNARAYCVDSRGTRDEISNDSCNANITRCD